MRSSKSALIGHPPQIELDFQVRLLLVVAALVGSLTVGIQRADAAAYTITHPVHPDHIDNVHWSDTWGAPRSGGRSHIGVDIMGPRMTPLVAANDAVVTWGEFDNAGGNIIRIRDTRGWEYQYIHINNDAPGTDDGNASCLQAFAAKICNTLDGNRIRRGLSFKAGELIAYMGDSGNAEWVASHLHFEVYAPNGEGGVTPVNPTPFVDAAAANPPTPAPDVPDTPLPDGSPWPDISTAVFEIFEAIEGRYPSNAEAGELSQLLQNQSVEETLADVIAENNSAAMVDRLYLIFFGRTPDADGYDYWIDERSHGESLEDIAEWFAQSAEFQRRYGGGTFGDFLNRLYTNVLDRDPDVQGNRYWLDQLERGDVNRGTIVVYFSEGKEAVARSRLRTERTVLERILTGERPTENEIAQWVSLRADHNLADAIDILLG
ncbi:MAG: DUF4214 domain-containing protein [Acidimicrobiia bacterium]|nr:DUF4214 domain-containing protein [Acidimicrobiia bacterium]